MAFDWGLAVVLVATSFLTALSALMIMLAFGRSRRTALQDHFPADDETVFLFDDDLLIDATPAAREMLSQGPSGLNDWQKLLSLLTPRFPDLPKIMAHLPETGVARLVEDAGATCINARLSGGIARISIAEPKVTEVASIDPQSLAALHSELDILRRVVTDMPTLSWQQNKAGDVTWANKSYLKLVEQTLSDHQDLVWPLPRLFADSAAPLNEEDLSPHRVSIKLPDGDVNWFDSIAIPHEQRPMFFALPANATVRAETSLRNFVQTLTKTFADLPTGLAIFNRSRHLVLFNPSLVDLCAVDAGFLTARPSLAEFLDRMREKQMVPEPKDYKSWRQKIIDLEQEATNGIFEETWSLPSGQTYRVSGRPHPDGAVAFLFEDISAEMSLTRRFRGELEMNQSVLDAMPEAIAVFSPEGALTLTNASFNQLWAIDPSQVYGVFAASDMLKHMQARTLPSEAWTEANQIIAGQAPANEWRGKITTSSGSALSCRIQHLGRGGTLIGFSDDTGAQQVASNLQIA